MSQASVEEDGVSWIDDTGGPSCTENVSTMDSANLTPAEVQFYLWYLYEHYGQFGLFLYSTHRYKISDHFS